MIARKLFVVPLSVLLLFLDSGNAGRMLSGQTSTMAANSDLYAAVEQSLVTKVVNDAQYPITLMDQWWPFDPNSRLTDRTYSASQVENQLTAARALDCSSRATAKETACQIQSSYFAGLEQFHEQLRLLRDMKAKAGNKWKGPSDSELSAIENQVFPVKEHLAHLKINLLRAPSVTISGISTAVNGVSVAVDAIAETYVEYPVFVCTKTCSIGPLHICCEGHLESRWAKALEVDVNDVRLAIDGAADLSVEGLVVYGSPSVSRLALDYAILRDINLAPIANSILGGRRLAIIDASNVVAALPYVNTKYKIQSINLSGNAEIRADIVVQKFP